MVQKAVGLFLSTISNSSCIMIGKKIKQYWSILFKTIEFLLMACNMFGIMVFCQYPINEIITVNSTKIMGFHWSHFILWFRHCSPKCPVLTTIKGLTQPINYYRWSMKFQLGVSMKMSNSQKWWTSFIMFWNTGYKILKINQIQSSIRV